MNHRVVRYYHGNNYGVADYISIVFQNKYTTILDFLKVFLNRKYPIRCFIESWLSINMF